MAQLLALATMPTIQVLLGFGEAWNPSSWEEISTYVQTGATVAGTDHELSTVVAGTCKLLLDNRDARFNPWNSSGPYAGIGNGLTPQQPIQVLTQWPAGANLFTSNDSQPDTSSGVGTWGSGAATTNVTTVSTTLTALSVTATTSGTEAKCAGGMYPVIAGATYCALATATTVTSAAIVIEWFNSLGTHLSSTASTPGSGSISVVGSAPVGAVTCAVVIQWLPTSNGQVVDWTQLGLFFAPVAEGVPNWVVGTGAVSAVESQFYGYVDSWIPTWQDVLSPDLNLSATDVFGMFNVDDMSSSGYETLVASNSPQTYYTLGDDAGSLSAVDSSGNGQTALVQGNGSTFGESGLLACDIGTSLVLAVNALNTADTQLDMPHTVFGSSPTNLTMTFWLETTTTVSSPGFEIFQVLFTSAGIPNTQSMIFAFAPSGWMTGFAGVDALGTGNGLLFNSGKVINDGNIHMITLRVYNLGSATNGVVSMEVDGVLEMTSPPGALAPFPTGYNAFLTSDQGSFTMSQFAIFDSIVSSSVTAELYQLGTEGFVTQFSGQRIATALANATFPSDMTDIATGQSEMQPATSTLVGTSLLSYIQGVQTSEQGYLFQAPNGTVTFYDRHYPITSSSGSVSQAVFEDSVSSNYYYEITNFTPGLNNLDLWNQIQAAAQPGPVYGTTPIPSGATQQAQNAPSQANYGKRTYSVTGLLVTTDTEALEVAQWLNVLYSEPLQRLRAIQLKAVTDAGVNLPQMLGRALYDRITVIYNGLVGGTPFQQDSIIEGIEHTWNVEEWSTIFRLSPAQVQDWFILDSPTNGVLDQSLLAY